MRSINFFTILLFISSLFVIVASAFLFTRFFFPKTSEIFVSKQEEQRSAKADTLLIKSPFIKREEEIKILILLGETNLKEKHFIQNEIKTITDFLEELANISFQIVTEGSFLKLKKNWNEVIFLLDQMKFKAKTFSLIKDYVYRGCGILLVGNPAIFDSFSLLAHIAGCIAIEDSAKEGDYQEVLLKAHTPLTCDLNPGQMMGLAGFKNRLIRVVEPRVRIAGHYKSLKTNLPDSPSITYGFYGKGRFVATGFYFSSLTADSFTQKAARIFLNNLCNWLAFKPLLEIKHWPKSREWVATITADIEFKSHNANEIAQILKDKSAKATFFFLTEAAQDFRFKDFEEDIEIAVHSSEHTSLQGKSYSCQKRIITEAKKKLKKQFKKDILGFHPPYLAYDTTTLKILIEENFDYLLAGFKTGDAFAPYYQNRLVVFPQTVWDDYELIFKKGVKGEKELFNYFYNAFLAIKKIGGLAVFSIHSQILGEPNYRPTFAQLLDSLKKEEASFFFLKEIAEWWQKRSQIKIELKNLPQGYRLTIINRGSKLVNDVAVRFYLPTFFKTNEEKESLVFLQNSRILFDYEAVEINIPEIKPNESKVLDMIFNSFY